MRSETIATSEIVCLSLSIIPSMMLLRVEGIEDVCLDEVGL